MCDDFATVIVDVLFFNSSEQTCLYVSIWIRISNIFIYKIALNKKMNEFLGIIDWYLRKLSRCNLSDLRHNLFTSDLVFDGPRMSKWHCFQQLCFCACRNMCVSWKVNLTKFISWTLLTCCSFPHFCWMKFEIFDDSGIPALWWMIRGMPFALMNWLHKCGYCCFRWAVFFRK